MEKYTVCIGIVVSVSFLHFFPFFYSYFLNVKKAASGACFRGAKVVSLSLFDLFQMPVCLRCWTQPFCVL